MVANKINKLENYNKSNIMAGALAHLRPMYGTDEVAYWCSRKGLKQYYRYKLEKWLIALHLIPKLHQSICR